MKLNLQFICIWPSRLLQSTSASNFLCLLCWNFKSSCCNNYDPFFLIPPSKSTSESRVFIYLVYMLFFNLNYRFCNRNRADNNRTEVFKPKPNPKLNRRLRFSILKTEDIWLRFRFYPETEPNRPCSPLLPPHEDQILENEQRVQRIHFLISDSHTHADL